ncbi:tetratricopeptide repeat protein [Pedobacter paludis]|uniref:Uncharacterized protein n=1 Tax=Pedobacter paludis TaxID=2203212 RepID=A0A317EUZ6_9SPHI|nr:tetratricopeptide repeat protein [Pedobacter paludis]PWS30252.1 hypothetical protein DF947_17605 [Pedobacter paludis]
MNFALILLLGGILCRISFMLITVIHELGHALTGMRFSAAGATVYLGSHGDVHGSYKCSAGKLTVYIRRNPFKWSGGMCVLDDHSFSVNKKIVELLAGPLSPFLMAAAAFSLSMYFDAHGSVRLLLAVFLGVSIFSMFQSLIPSSRPVTTFQGKQVNNDGRQIRNLVRIKRAEPALNRAVALYDEGNYAQAGMLFEQQVLKVIREPEIFRLATLAYLHSKDYEKAWLLSVEHLKVAGFEADDFSNAALACSNLDKTEEAVHYYRQALALDPDHKYALNNFGFTLNDMERYGEAVAVFDRAIEVDPLFAYSYCNRGLSRIMLGDAAGGLADIEKSLGLDAENAYAYRNLGIYYLRQGDAPKALELFGKAKSADPCTHKIDYFMEAAAKLI